MKEKDFCKRQFIKQSDYSIYKSEWFACGLVSLWTALKILGQDCIEPQELVHFSGDPNAAENGVTPKQMQKIALEFGCKLYPFRFRADFKRAWNFAQSQNELGYPIILYLNNANSVTSRHASLIHGTTDKELYLMEPNDLTHGYQRLTQSDFQEYLEKRSKFNVISGVVVKPFTSFALKLFSNRKDP